jgi:iron complex transport system substrate-binding protein
VKSVVSFSTTHIGFISALNKTETIKGISGKDYFYDSFLRKLYGNGKIVDVGYPPSIDYETIVRINPDVVFLYGLGASEAAIIKRLADAGISTIMISEFLEDHPLGKAEWIKLFAVLFDLKEKGDSLFDAVSGHYNELIPFVRDLQQKPRVLTGLPWKGTWNMAGGSSFTARLIEDAGGDYLWKDDNSREFIPLSLEAVFSRAGDADIWINTGTATSIPDLISRDKRFENIRAIRKGLVFNNNARLNPSGGNDYWESGTVRPDLILRDLISVFHPEVLEDNELIYYRKLE